MHDTHRTDTTTGQPFPSPTVIVQAAIDCGYTHAEGERLAAAALRIIYAADDREAARRRILSAFSIKTL